MNIPLYSIKGEQAGTFELPEAVFNVAPNAAMLHDMVIAYQANNRQVLAHTKTRAEVSGGGKKPWKQKGTGRARHGSSRSPLWVGGGITFGPRGTRNFEKKVNKKTARKALAMVLSDRVKTNGLFLVENYKFDALKTKNGAALIKKLVGSKNNVLVVLPKEEKQVTRCFQNIDNVETMRVDDMNVYEAMKSKQILMSVDSIQLLVSRLTK